MLTIVMRCPAQVAGGSRSSQYAACVGNSRASGILPERHRTTANRSHACAFQMLHERRRIELAHARGVSRDERKSLARRVIAAVRTNSRRAVDVCSAEDLMADRSWFRFSEGSIGSRVRFGR